MTEKKSTKKVTTKRQRKPKEKIVEEKTLMLSESEMRVIENSINDITTSSLRMAAEEQAHRNLKLELELLEIKIEKKKILVADENARLEKRKAIYNKLIKDICEKYNISNTKFGYNPESGEIIC